MKSIARTFTMLALGAAAVVSVAQTGGHKPLIGLDVLHLGKQSKPKRTQHSGKHGSAIVFYDSTSSFGWAGDLYAQMLADVLTHFDHTTVTEAVESYKAGDMKKYNSAYYLGFIYNNALPQAFLTDVLQDTKPFCWCGFNLWELAWVNGQYQVDNPAFVNKTGIRFMGLDETGYAQVAYNGTNLNKNQTTLTEGAVAISNPSQANAVATSVSPSTGATIPYITQGGGNFWYVADNPFMDQDNTALQDRQIAFDDVLHQITGVNHATQHRAFLRIEDVSAHSDPAQLKAIADTLYAEKIPYVVCVIPEFMDPNGVYYNGVPTDIPMWQSPAFVKALQYMQSKGGQIIMHGYTHQYSNVDNAFDGVSADDFEFWRVGLTQDGAIQYIGQIPEDSPSWVHRRIITGLLEMALCGFFPTGWNTPHYAASPMDYDEFANDFQYSLDRALVFSNQGDGTTMNYLNLFSPFTYTDEHGMYHLPETCGYVAPGGILGGPSTLPSDLINRAQANLACRDGWAGCYYHWFLGTDLLKQLVDGIKGQGYTFVKPSAHIDNN